MQHGSGVRNSKRGDRTAYPGALAIGPGVSHRKAPGNAFPDRRSPVRPVGRIGTWNMGLPPDRRKHIDAALARPATGPIPGSAIRAKVNRFYRI